MMNARLTPLVGVLAAGALVAQSLPAWAQSSQVNGSTQQPAATTQQPAQTNQTAPQVQVNTPAPAPAAAPAAAPAQSPVVVQNTVNTESGGAMKKPAGRLMVSGATLFGVTYLGTVLGAAIVSDVCNAESRFGCREANWPIYIPVVGPFVQMGYISGTGANTGRALLAIDGALQAGGLAMFIAGAAMYGASSGSSTQQHAKKVQVVPTGTGMMAFGRF